MQETCMGVSSAHEEEPDTRLTHLKLKCSRAIGHQSRREAYKGTMLLAYMELTSGYANGNQRKVVLLRKVELRRDMRRKLHSWHHGWTGLDERRVDQKWHFGPQNTKSYTTPRRADGFCESCWKSG